MRGYILLVVGFALFQEFRADPEVIKSGDGADLIWSVSDAESVVIEPEIGSVHLNGTKTVFPNESIVYTLKASNSVGASEEAVRITLKFETWKKTFGGSGWDAGFSVKQTSDNGYIVTGGTVSYGAGSYDVWLIKTDSAGNQLWSKTFGGTDYDMGCSVQETSDGGYIVAGLTDSFGGGSDYIYLIKTNSDSKKLWEKTLGENYGDIDLDMIFFSVQETKDGGYIIGGTKIQEDGKPDVRLIKTDPSGNEMWEKTFDETGLVSIGNSAQETSDGGYIIVGYGAYESSGDCNVWLIKTDPSGNSNS